LRYMVNTLTYAYDTKKKQTYDPRSKLWIVESVPTMDSACVVQLVDTVYSHTAQRHPSNDEKPPETPEKEKGKAAESSNGEEIEDELEVGPSKNGTHPFPHKLTEKMLPRDPMRRLIARYCASRLVELKEAPEFMALVREKGEFAEDLIVEIDKERTRVKIDEMDRLGVS
jgi:hypothetical protein